MVGLTLKEALNVTGFRAKRFMIIFRPTNSVAITANILAQIPKRPLNWEHSPVIFSL